MALSFVTVNSQSTVNPKNQSIPTTLEFLPATTRWPRSLRTLGPEIGFCLKMEAMSYAAAFKIFRRKVFFPNDIAKNSTAINEVESLTMKHLVFPIRTFGFASVSGIIVWILTNHSALGVLFHEHLTELFAYLASVALKLITLFILSRFLWLLWLR